MNPELVAIIESYAQTHALNLPPHNIVSDMVAEGPSGVEQLLAMLGTTINAGDPLDNAQAQAGQAEREAQLNDAQTKFPANEDASAAKLASAGDPAQMLQSMPQMASGVAGAMAGALGGALQPFGQFAQEGLQAGQQALQAGFSALQQGAASGAAAGAVPAEMLGAESGLGAGGGAGDLAGAAGGGVGGGLGGGTTPAAVLGPPPTPSGGTGPASSPTTPPPLPQAPAGPAGAQRGPMGAMPMMPPAAMHGGAAAGNDKTDTKRVVAPSVKNGAPVQGRITTPPAAPEVIKRVEGKPVAARRILAPDPKLDDDSANPGR